VTSAVWSTALWPERRVPLQTIANRLSEARRALGFAADHRARLRKVADRHLLVEVATDWELFQRLAGPGSSLEDRRAALQLVRGRPFANLHQGQWVAFEGFEAEIELAVVECALHAGEELIASGRPEPAAWAAQQALRASPWDERLYRLLMRSADASGNRAGVESAMRTLALVLEIDGDPLVGVHPETAALYASLVGRQPVRTS
jgi:DNA-binding SARP family transcriptional activator